MLTVTLVDVKFPSSTALFLVKFLRYSIYKQQMSSEKKHLTLFFISVFPHFVFFINSVKVFYFMFHVNAWTASVCILTVVAYTNLTSFYSGQHVHRSRHAGSQKHFRCINDLDHSEFPISALPCCTVLIMISARVIGLRSLESDVFYNS